MTDVSRSNSLADLAARIRQEHTEVAAALRRSVDRAISAGDLLLEAKAKLDHGQWSRWLADSCRLSERTAQRYMRLARNRAVIESKSDAVSDLTISGALALLTAPRDTVEAQLVDMAVESLSNSEEIEAALASIAETARRRAILDDALRDLDAMGALICKNQHLAELQVRGDRFRVFAPDEAAYSEWKREYLNAVFTDDYARSYQMVVQLGGLVGELRNLVEAKVAS